MTLEELIARRNEIEIANQAFLAALEGGTALSDEDQATLTANVDEFDTLTTAIEQRERIAAQTVTLGTGNGRQSAPTAAAPGTPAPRRNVQGTTAGRAQNGMGGFDNMGSFAQSIIQAAVNPHSVDERLQIMNAPQGNNTLTPSEGGYLVPPDFRETIMEKMTNEQSLLGRTDGLQTGSNAITIPKSAVEQWASTGVQGYWTAEGNAITASKAVFAQTTIPLWKLAALVPVTEEQMEDGPLIESYLNRKVPDKLDWMISDAILNGDGSGKPFGILDADALSKGTIALTRSASAADVIDYDDVLALWGTLYAPWRNNAVWLINPAVEEKLNKLSFEGTSSSVPAYMPANGLSATPYGTLMGRPVIPHQALGAAGAAGDVLLADMSQYLTATKVNGVRSDVSMHVYFATDELAFRFIIRVGGEPWWDTVVSANNGTYDQSAFVTLAAGA